jgi:hypothetical protein
MHELTPRRADTQLAVGLLKARAGATTPFLAEKIKYPKLKF